MQPTTGVARLVEIGRLDMARRKVHPRIDAQRAAVGHHERPRVEFAAVADDTDGTSADLQPVGHLAGLAHARDFPHHLRWQAGAQQRLFGGAQIGVAPGLAPGTALAQGQRRHVRSRGPGQDLRPGLQRMVSRQWAAIVAGAQRHGPLHLLFGPVAQTHHRHQHRRHQQRRSGSGQHQRRRRRRRQRQTRGCPPGGAWRCERTPGCGGQQPFPAAVGGGAAVAALPARRQARQAGRQALHAARWLAAGRAGLGRSGGCGHHCLSAMRGIA